MGIAHMLASQFVALLQKISQAFASAVFLGGGGSFREMHIKVDRDQAFIFLQVLTILPENATGPPGDHSGRPGYPTCPLARTAATAVLLPAGTPLRPP